MNPKIGQTTKGREVGKRGGSATSQFIWSKCVDCDKERWVICFRGNARNRRCKKCGGIYAASKLPTMAGKNNPSWKGGRIRDRGYIRIHRPYYPGANAGGYVLEHRLVWEKANRKILPDDWVVHHLNGIKDDNRPVNLLAMPRKDHHDELVNQALKKRIRDLEGELRVLRLKKI